MQATRALSKTRYQQGRQCEKRLWLEVHRRELATPPDGGLRARLAQGHRLGALARLRWPGHTLVREPAARHERAVRVTAGLIADPSVPAVCEAAFAHDGVRVRVDVLARRSDCDAFDLIEVKSTSRVKPEHLSDAGVQLYVVEASGVCVAGVGLLHVDPDYVWQGGAYDWDRLFRLADVGDAARAASLRVAHDVAGFRRLLDADRPPPIAVGDQCRSPYACPFLAHCTAGTGSSVIGTRPHDARALARCWERIEYPVAFVAPLMAHPALPLIPGTRPFERIPVGWALGLMAASGAARIRSFVAGDLESCGRVTLAALAAALPRRGSIVVAGVHEHGVLAQDPSTAEVADRATALSRLLDLAAERVGPDFPPDAHSIQAAALAARAATTPLGPASLSVDVTSAAADAFDTGTAPARREDLRARLGQAATTQVEGLMDLFGWLREAAGSDGADG